MFPHSSAFDAVTVVGLSDMADLSREHEMLSYFVDQMYGLRLCAIMSSEYRHSCSHTKMVW